MPRQCDSVQYSFSVFHAAYPLISFHSINIYNGSYFVVHIHQTHPGYIFHYIITTRPCSLQWSRTALEGSLGGRSVRLSVGGGVSTRSVIGRALDCPYIRPRRDVHYVVSRHVAEKHHLTSRRDLPCHVT